MLLGLLVLSLPISFRARCPCCHRWRRISWKTLFGLATNLWRYRLPDCRSHAEGIAFPEGFGTSLPLPQWWRWRGWRCWPERWRRWGWPGGLTWKAQQEPLVQCSRRSPYLTSAGPNRKRSRGTHLGKGDLLWPLDAPWFRRSGREGSRY